MGQSAFSKVVLLIALLVFARHSACDDDLDDAVAGPVVKLADVPGQVPAAQGNATETETESGIGNIADVVHETAKEVAREVDKTLIKEFGNGTHEEEGKSFAAALRNTSADGTAKEEGKLETVVRISGSASALQDPSNKNATAEKAMDTGSSALDAPVEASVDRIIDQHDNEFVLSKSGSDVSILTVDTQLVTDLTVVLVSAAVMGTLFEALGQPTINGYLIAGAMVGPGGLKLVKELVQVESIAQLGVFVLLFALGMELSLSRVRSVLGVSIVGGSLQIMLAMVTGAAISTWMCDSPIAPGAFTGALLAMSSTSVVVKCLEATRSMNTSYGMITVGTLILQDCWVGLLFALLPLFKPPAVALATAVAAAAAGAVAPVATGGATEGVMLLQSEAAVDPHAAEAAAEHTAMVILAIFKVLLRILLVGGASLLLAKVALAHLLRLLVRHGSQELNQIVMIGFCLTTTWVGGTVGISRELGAFLGGLMVSAAAAASVALPGPPLVFGTTGAAGIPGGREGHKPSDGGSAEEAKQPSKGLAFHTIRPLVSVPNGGAAAPTKAAASASDGSVGVATGVASSRVNGGPHSRGGDVSSGTKATITLDPDSDSDVEGQMGGGGVWGGSGHSGSGSGAEELQHALRHNIDSVQNLLVALFIVSTALIISPRFLWQHIHVLAVGTLLVMSVKTVLVAGTVSWFGYSWRTSLAIGLTMAHVGEFAFVLLSTSSQLNILPPQVYQLLLGVTALSLLATPLVIILCSRLLREAPAVGEALFKGSGARRAGGTAGAAV